MSVIETHELRKTYGRIEALKGVSLKVEKGQIYGLLGQNGAGKTTLIKILLGIVKKTAGEASLLDQQAGTVAGEGQRYEQEQRPAAAEAIAEPAAGILIHAVEKVFDAAEEADRTNRRAECLEVFRQELSPEALAE